MVNFIAYYLFYYCLKNNCSNYCNRSVQQETQPYVDLERNNKNNKKNEGNVNVIKLRNLSPARKK